MTMQLHYQTLGAIRQGIFVVRADVPGHPITFVNDAFEAVTGRAAGEVIGQSCAWLFGGPGDAGEADAELAGKHLTAALEGQATSANGAHPGLLSVSEIHEDGSRYYIALIGHQDATAAVAGPVANPVADPVTDMGEIVHKLRGPLSACVAWVDLLGLTNPDSPEISSAVAAIRRNLDRQRQMIDDLLDGDRVPR